MDKDKRTHTRILLISEINDYIDTLRKWLEEEDYEVIGIFSFTRIIEFVQELQPNIILLNVEIDEASGIEIAHRLKIIRILNIYRSCLFIQKRTYFYIK